MAVIAKSVGFIWYGGRERPLLFYIDQKKRFSVMDDIALDQNLSVSAGVDIERLVLRITL